MVVGQMIGGAAVGCRARGIVTRRSAVRLLASGAGLLLGGCSLFGNRAAYRCRMTIEVDTAEGARVGSSVLEIESYKEAVVVGDRGGGHTGLAGEAVAIDLPGGPVFALLTLGDGARNLAAVITEALAPEARTGDFDQFLAAVRKLGSGAYRGELRRTRSSDGGVDEPNWPVMVRFASTADPASVERLDPDQAGIRHIMLETTDAPLTIGIERRLPWLVGHTGSLVRIPAGETPDQMPFGYFITDDQFSTEIKRA